MPDAAMRASVRKMVEFSLRGGDLLPVSMQAMQAGARGHMARQAAESAEAEKSLQWRGECAGILCEISGRADMVWTDCTPPCIEELKLADSPPSSPHPQHRMQAVSYAFMLCEMQSLPEASIRVSYIAENGAVLRSFEETLTHEEARDAFFSVLRPLAAWEKMQVSYRRQRDSSLAALPFPYRAYRPGQREMAVQVYTAIRRKKRLFAILPTGTGKSIAALYPALKALGNGQTRQIFYLTARGTARLSAFDALERLGQHGMQLRALTLTAREKCCPVTPMRCHPDHCPRARGYYDRELPALLHLAQTDSWSQESIQDICESFQLCPFEFSLLLSEYSDVVVCDYNYVFDPMVSLRRIIGQGLPVTLLMDEAHNLPGRTRDMLSAVLDSRALCLLRRECGRLYGRRDALYTAFTALLQPLRAFQEGSDPMPLLSPLEKAIDIMSARVSQPQPEGFTAFFRELLQFRLVLQRYAAHQADYRLLFTQSGHECSLRLLCLNISTHLAAATRRMNGCIYFSATLTPLPAMRRLLGGEEEDALFALPSPFPPENLLVLCQNINTRYQKRQESAASVARAILAMYESRSGSYIAYFPSYAYLELIRNELLLLCPSLALNVQERGMDETARAAFLNRIRGHDGALLSLCVLGGIFAEGVDLPGMQLIGTAIVGIGLPQVNEEQEALRAYYESAFGDGFAYAYRYPGMQKVLQAAGRVIRSEQDTGVVLLIDERYGDRSVFSLLPAHYKPVFVRREEEIRAHTQEFWHFHGIMN